MVPLLYDCVPFPLIKVSLFLHSFGVFAKREVLPVQEHKEGAFSSPRILVRNPRPFSSLSITGA